MYASRGDCEEGISVLSLEIMTAAKQVRSGDEGGFDRDQHHRFVSQIISSVVCIFMNTRVRVLSGRLLTIRASIGQVVFLRAGS
jgi:hypothetical protein